MDPLSKVDYSLIMPEASMAMKKTSGGDSLSGRVPGRASRPSQSWVDDGGGSRCVSGKVIGCLGFSRRGVFIGEGAASEVDQGALTIGRRGQALGHALWW
jgi:hypothetical protein